MKKRTIIVAIMLCVLMAVSSMPMSAFALDGEESDIISQMNEERAEYADRWKPAEGTMRTLDPEHFKRYAGKNRYETALLVADDAKNFFAGSFPNIIVASGADYPDALGASYLNYVMGAPILLVNKNNIKQIAQYIGHNLRPYNEETEDGCVFIMGGKGAVPAEMETELAAAGITKDQIVRFAGSNRYDTNLRMLKSMGAAGGAVICSGKNYADALSASAVGFPIMLVGDELTAEQKKYIEDNEMGRFLIFGGSGAVSKAVENDLKAYSTANEGFTQRISGTDRYLTSAAIAESFNGPDTQHAALTYGLNFPDGLSGCTLCFMYGGPMLLATDAQITPAADSVRTLGVKYVSVLGGTTLISDEAASTLIQ